MPEFEVSFLYPFSLQFKLVRLSSPQWAPPLPKDYYFFLRSDIILAPFPPRLSITATAANIINPKPWYDYAHKCTVCVTVCMCVRARARVTDIKLQYWCIFVSSSFIWSLTYTLNSMLMKQHKIYFHIATEAGSKIIFKGVWQNVQFILIIFVEVIMFTTKTEYILHSF